MEETKKRDWLLPASILVAALLVSVSLVYSAGKKSSGGTANLKESVQSALPSNPSVNNIRPISADDHIRGNPNAPVKIVEFSDLECPFCKAFHPTMLQVLQTYGDKVAWVYRHFPLDTIHPKARKEAEATECAAELGGNDTFWAYVDRLFEVTPSNNRLDLALLPQIAADIGLDRAAFQSCLDSGKYAERIARDLEDAINSGGRGTPYSVVVTAAGNYPISGAVPFEALKSVIDQVLAGN